MAGAAPRVEVRPLTPRARVVRALLIGVSLTFLGLLLAAPLGAVLAQALAKGWAVYMESFSDPDTLAAIRLTLITAAIVVPVNTIFGICASWAIAKFEFKGKSLLITLIDLPFAVSPVIAGLVFVLLFGAQGWFGPWLLERDVQIIFAMPGIVLATLFITFPYVARELIPLMQQQGSEEEEAAITLGASAWVTFLRVTLPKIRWGLLYGIILCNARAMGEFGAVSVVSGHIRGLTNTMPLQVEILYNEYNFVAAFAVASLLALLAILTLVLKTLAGGSAGSADACLLTPQRRRLLLMASLERGTRWAMFELPERAVRQKLERQVEAFLQPLASSGLFGPAGEAGTVQVVCDDRVNGPDDVAAGRINVLVSLPSGQPGQWRSFMVMQSRTGGRVRPVRANVLPPGTRMTVRVPEAPRTADDTQPTRTLAQELFGHYSEPRPVPSVVATDRGAPAAAAGRLDPETIARIHREFGRRPQRF